MSFTFGFGGDDIENESDDNDDLTEQVEDYTINDTAALVSPKRHTLQDLLTSLPSQISYNILTITKQIGNDDTAAAHETSNDQTGSDVTIPRRSMFDIRAQLMAEANVDENQNDSLLAGLENGDLTSGIYEGGFKTWECALDLASLVAKLSMDRDMHVIELGAGSAIPSLVLLDKALRLRPISSPEAQRTLHFSLCDYNEDVLKLATVANVLLVSELSRQQQDELYMDQDMEIDDIDEDKIGATAQYLREHKISFDLISGAWGDEFLQMIPSSSSAYEASAASNRTTLILASETIYSPKSIQVFTSCLMQLLRRDVTNSKAWIAAKKVYFGVGGGVDAFVDEVARQQGTVRTLVDIKGSGVSRVVLEITAK